MNSRRFCPTIAAERSLTGDSIDRFLANDSDLTAVKHSILLASIASIDIYRSSRYARHRSSTKSRLFKERKSLHRLTIASHRDLHRCRHRSRQHLAHCLDVAIHRIRSALKMSRFLVGSILRFTFFECIISTNVAQFEQ